VKNDGRVPRLGEDTDRVLREFGFGDEEIGELRAEQIIGG
jgi:crotonobetainyl-CoA:carnitine CoA-transferase CaiB-like acyl-CoA transferase